MGTGFKRVVLLLIFASAFFTIGLVVNVDKVLALSIYEQAHVNELKKVNPAEGRRLEKGLKDIEKSKDSSAKKTKAREKLISKTFERTRTLKRAADKFGTVKSKADAATGVAIMLGMQFSKFGSKFISSRVEKEIKRLQKVAKKEKEQKNKRADSSTSSTSAFTETPFTITMGGQGGQMHRSSVSFLRTELGGNVINPRFAAIQRNNQIAGINFEAQVNFDERPIMGKQVGLSPFFGLNNNYAWAHVDIPNLSAMGNQLGILGVEGPTGPLNGGLITGAGFGDLTNAQYREYYDETILTLGVKGRINLDEYLGKKAGSSLVVHGAFMYGSTNERSYFGGVTNSGTVNFRYNNKIESDRFGLQLGMKYKYSFNEDFGLFANGAVRFIHNKASGYTMLDSDFNGVPFASEYQRLSKTNFDVGGIVGAGLFADAGPITGYAGVEGELWQVPVLRVTGTERAHLEYKDRTSWTVKIGLRVDF